MQTRTRRGRATLIAAAAILCACAPIVRQNQALPAAPRTRQAALQSLAGDDWAFHGSALAQAPIRNTQ